MTTSTPAATTTWTQRSVEAITSRLSRSHLSRRSFLTRTALVGSALTVDPTGFLLRPRSAHASVCGDEPECWQGWSAFCATINDGANTCPTGSYTAGWWKIDNSVFCRGAARYIVDCNVRPGANYNCTCADGTCDHRRVACNDFRYGQCNTQIPGTTPVVCRIVICTPPWQWDNCTTTSHTANATRTHWSERLPSRTNPTPITVRWLEMGLNGSVVGAMTGGEYHNDTGTWARFAHGIMTDAPGSETFALTGPHAQAYQEIANGPSGWLGFPLEDVLDNPAQARFEHGHTYATTDLGVIPVWGGVDDYYRSQGGPAGWLGEPAGRTRTSSGFYIMLETTSGWWVVHSTVEAKTRVLRSIASLRADGHWPATVDVVRWWGNTRFETATDISRRTYPNGTDTVLIARGDDWPDAASAGAIVGLLNAPILLTLADELPQATLDEIRRLGPVQAILLGGTQAIGPAVATALANEVDTVQRWAGANRHATSAEISANAFPEGAPHVVIATGAAFPDSLAVAPLAYLRHAPVLLTQPDAIPSEIATELERLGASTATIVGGTNAVSENVRQRLVDDFGLVVNRIAGTNRSDTAAAVALELGGSSTSVAVATASDFPDALTSSAYTDRRRTPLLLVGEAVDPASDAEILRRRPERIVMIGGPSALSDHLLRQLGGYLR